MPWGTDETSLPDKIIFGPVLSGRFVWLSDVWDDFDEDEQPDQLRAEMTGAALDAETGEPFTDSGEWTFRWSVCRSNAKSPFEIVEYDPEDSDEISGLVVENVRGKDFNSMSGMGRFVNALMSFVPADELVDWGMPEDIRTFYGRTFVLQNQEFEGPAGPYHLHLPISLGEAAEKAAPAKRKAPSKVEAARRKLRPVPAPEAEKGTPKKKKSLRDAVVEMAAKYDDEEEFYTALFDPSKFAGAEKLLEDQNLQDELEDIWNNK